VAWFNDRNCFLLAVALYGVSVIYSVFLWRKGFRRDNRVNYILLGVAFLFHTASIFQRGYRLNHCPVTNLYEATTFAVWSLVGVYLIVGFWSRLRFLGAFASPIVFAISIFALMPGLDTPHDHLAPVTIWTSLHAALLSLAYGAFGLSSIAALMYLTQERNLKLHRLRGVFSLLPPIERLEIIVSRLLLVGFVLLSAGLAAGGYSLSTFNHPQAYRGDPKIIWSGLVWLVYLSLLVMRWKFSQGGRRFALGAVGTFVFVLLTFWGVNLLSPLHNP
jgi:ABC-type transport system involved in cytochrome c biogenesis permease subunit